MLQPNAFSRRTGFTLVELLVVVAIIALLIALLLPSLSRARDRAKTVVCGSNMRQIGTLLAIYANQSSDFLPSHQGDEFYSTANTGKLVAFDPPMSETFVGTAVGVTTWIEALGCTGVIDPNNYWYNNSYKWNGNAALTQTKLNALNCPAALDGWSRWDAKIGTSYPGNTWSYAFTTGAGGSLFNGVTRGGTSASTTKVTADNRYRRRVGTLLPDHIMMGESTHYNNSLDLYHSASAAPNYLNYGENGVHLRHMFGEGANYLFADFHVEASSTLHKFTYASFSTSPGKVSNVWFQPE